jgi:antitoxin MazE
MEAVIRKWGNSLGLRLPKGIAGHFNLKDGSRIELQFEDDHIKIMPMPDKKITLEELMSKVNKTNIHNEIDTGTSVGNEAW